MSVFEEAVELAKALFDAEHAHAVYRTSCINLIASQNMVAPQVGRLLGSSFADQFMSGTIGHRPHGGGQWIDAMEKVVAELATKLFAPFSAELRPTSGSQANEIVVSLALKPGDVLISPAPLYGSHPSMRSEGLAGALGAVVYDLPFVPGSADIDLAELAELAERVKPKLISIGTAKVLFADPIAEVTKIAESVGALVHYDGAHVLGLIAGNAFANPLAGGAHFITGSTQKTMPGPIGGIILSRDAALGQKIADVTDTRLDNYQNNRIAGLGFVLAELLAEGNAFGQKIISNARTLAAGLTERGIAVEGQSRGYTETHMLLIDLTGLPTGAQARLEDCGLLATETKIWPATEGGNVRSCLRIGLAPVTRQSYSLAELNTLADVLADILKADAPCDIDKERVRSLAKSVGRRPIAFSLPDTPEMFTASATA